MYVECSIMTSISGHFCVLAPHSDITLYDETKYLDSGYLVNKYSESI